MGSPHSPCPEKEWDTTYYYVETIKLRLKRQSRTHSQEWKNWLQPSLEEKPSLNLTYQTHICNYLWTNNPKSILPLVPKKGFSGIISCRSECLRPQQFFSDTTTGHSWSEVLHRCHSCHGPNDGGASSKPWGSTTKAKRSWTTPESRKI